MVYVFSSPPISLSTAHTLALFFTGSYVGSLYISKSARLSFKKTAAKHLRDGEQRPKEYDERWRNDPEVIRARVIAAGLSTISSCTVVLGLLWELFKSDEQTFSGVLESALIRLGFDLNQFLMLSQAFSPCLVTPLLFLGPLYGDFLDSRLPLQRNWSWCWSVRPMYRTWEGFRNYIMGPLTEELVFRSCTLTVYHLAGASRSMMIFTTPLLFGIAHIHHAWDIFNRYGRTKAAAQRALLATTLQLSYTSLFGFHSAYLFLRTGSIMPPLTAHVFCNIMGLPQIGAQLAQHPRRRTSIKLAYILGIAGYIYTLPRWTVAKDSFYWQPEGLWSIY